MGLYPAVITIEPVVDLVESGKLADVGQANSVDFLPKPVPKSAKVCHDANEDHEDHKWYENKVPFNKNKKE